MHTIIYRPHGREEYKGQFVINDTTTGYSIRVQNHIYDIDQSMRGITRHDKISVRGDTTDNLNPYDEHGVLPLLKKYAHLFSTMEDNKELIITSEYDHSLPITTAGDVAPTDEAQ